MNISKDDFQALAVCSVRYAIGRSTYMPSWIASILTKHKKYLDKHITSAIIREISNASDLGDILIDKPVWLALREELRKNNVC